MSNHRLSVAIIGAGPAGLTAAYLLGKAGTMDVQVFEAHPTLVGGISRTETYKGFHFNIGGHRFFSKSKEVEDFWTEILGDEMLERPRSSRIYFNQHFFAYPLAAGEALRKLGIIEAARCVLSYLQAKMFPVANPKTFEDWVSNQFGKRLYQLFFKTYTEKVWGIPCSEISADWAAQRIQGLSLMAAIRNALFPPKRKKGNDTVIKTLIDAFRYPKFGPGQIWTVCKQKAEAFGVSVHMNTGVQTMQLNANQSSWSLLLNDGQKMDGFDYVISTAAIKDVIGHPASCFTQDMQQAARALQYRDFLTVVLILKDEQRFNDNWIYIHDPAVKVGRIQHFKSWSPYMVPDADKVCYGLEYFCFEGDGMWTATDTDLCQMAAQELEHIGLGKASEVLDAYVVRQPKAYPIYNQDYLQQQQIIRDGLQAYPGLILVGRNGMHKYNNQDHSMMTAMLAVKNILAGENLYDVWQVNQDAIYHESGERGAEEGGRLVPVAVQH